MPDERGTPSRAASVTASTTASMPASTTEPTRHSGTAAHTTLVEPSERRGNKLNGGKKQKESKEPYCSCLMTASRKLITAPQPAVSLQNSQLAAPSVLSYTPECVPANTWLPCALRVERKGKRGIEGRAG